MRACSLLLLLSVVAAAQTGTAVKYHATINDVKYVYGTAAPPITRTVEDAAALLQVLAGYDPLDAITTHEPVPDYSQAFRLRHCR